MTVGEIKTELLGRVENNSEFYDSQELLDAINEAHLIVQLMTGHRQVTVPLSRFTTARRMVYRVPQTILIPTAVYFEKRVLGRSSLSSMNRAFPDWMRHETAQRGRVDRWAPIGTRLFAIHPADSVGGKHIEVSGVAAPSDLTTDDSVLEVEDIWADAVREQAFLALTMGDGGNILTDSYRALRADRGGIRELSRWKMLADRGLAVTVRVQR